MHTVAIPNDPDMALRVRALMGSNLGARTPYKGQRTPLQGGKITHWCEVNGGLLASHVTCSAIRMDLNTVAMGLREGLID
jgi:hypothetical protein